MSSSHVQRDQAILPSNIPLQRGEWISWSVQSLLSVARRSWLRRIVTLLNTAVLNCSEIPPTRQLHPLWTLTLITSAHGYIVTSVHLADPVRECLRLKPRDIYGNSLHPLPKLTNPKITSICILWRYALQLSSLSDLLKHVNFINSVPAISEYTHAGFNQRGMKNSADTEHNVC